jgi:hypothetical protein
VLGNGLILTLWRKHAIMTPSRPCAGNNSDTHHNTYFCYAVLCWACQVAAKVIQVASATELLNVLREIEALATLRHPNLVPFCAAVLEVRRTGCCCHCMQWHVSVGSPADGQLGGTACVEASTALNAVLPPESWCNLFVLPGAEVVPVCC